MRVCSIQETVLFGRLWWLQVQIVSAEILTSMFSELVTVVRSSGRGFATYLADLLKRCRVRANSQPPVFGDGKERGKILSGRWWVFRFHARS